MNDYLFRGNLSKLDSDINELIELEAERQVKKIILIPSESEAPSAVREALGSVFQNIYAEGYPSEITRWMTEEELFDYDARLAEYRRYSDPRYYKGVEYADTAESIARERCKQAFANDLVKADEIYVNVQALSGAPANNAVYHALANPGDTIMGLNLLHGGHLSHGSSVNRSGQYYNAVHYNVDPVTERIDYDQIEELAKQHKPKFIIAGYSSYPWSVDWARFRDIAHSVGAYLFADIAHVAGLVVGGVYPSPLGYADVITFTTHKSLCGPRGACILTTNRLLARKIDRAVFPGEQGGPHVNAFVAMAVAFKLAKTEQFSELQRQIVKNAVALTERFEQNGFRIPFGGTNTHMLNLDCSSVVGDDGVTLSGDQAARILDIVGFVVNRNTIPGDKSALDPSGIRLGTPWITQRGFKEGEMAQIADIISEVLMSAKPYGIHGRRRLQRRSKVDFYVLEEAKIKTRDLTEKAGIDSKVGNHGYPHFYYLDDNHSRSQNTILIEGDKVRSFLNFVLTSNVDHLVPGESQWTAINIRDKNISGTVKCITWNKFLLKVPDNDVELCLTWMRDLSDGYIIFDHDIKRKIPGPVIVKLSNEQVPDLKGERLSNQKPYFIGISDGDGEELKTFEWNEGETELRRTPLYATHKELGAKIIPFAGWEMPVWYSSVVEEHLAVRNAAGVFDVSHMGVYQVEGPNAAPFLDSVVGNDINGLEIGESCYTHLLDPDASVIDDLLVYHRDQNKYLMVVNASNDDKDWAWLNAVKEGEVKVSNARPWTKVYGRDVVLRNLRDPKEGKDMRVDIALQGPRSRDILLALGVDDNARKRILRLKRTELCEAIVGDIDLVVSRTGYTGEKMAFELFVHPNNATELFKKILAVGDVYGIKPVGLGARDSLRTEAGLPLYGHEMGGEKNLGVGDAGFGAYVKTYKPWFIGRRAFIEHENIRKSVVIRFRFDEKGVRMAHNSDPVVDKHGKVIGFVTSCAVDMEGYLTGQAYINLKFSQKGTPIYIFQNASAKAGKVPAELQVGDRIAIPTPATVVSRFPKL